MTNYKELFETMKKTDEIIDSTPGLEKSSQKVLDKLIKKTGAKGGAIAVYNLLDDDLKAVAKKGPLPYESLLNCFRKGEKIKDNKKIAVPIILNEKKLGAMCLYGKEFTEEDMNHLLASEIILDGKLGHESETAKLRGVFERYVDEKTMMKILKDPDKKILTGERHVCTILFADINDFSYFVNNYSPKNIVNFLNYYFEEMSKIALKYGGTIDKFVGDEIMVIFGSPLPQKDHAEKAIKAGKEMVRKMKKISREYKLGTRGLSVGIATGKVVSGNIGYKKRMDYTVVGKKVNLASRLTSAAGKNQIFVDKTTMKNSKNFTFVSMGKRNIKGFGEIEISRVKLSD